MGFFWLNAYCKLANDCKPVYVCFDFETRVVLGRAPLFNVVHVGEDVAGDLGDQVGLHVLRHLLGCHAIEDSGTRSRRRGVCRCHWIWGRARKGTVLGAIKGMCVVVGKSVSYHARAPVTGGYEVRVC